VVAISYHILTAFGYQYAYNVYVCVFACVMFAWSSVHGGICMYALFVVCACVFLSSSSPPHPPLWLLHICGSFWISLALSPPRLAPPPPAISLFYVISSRSMPMPTSLYAYFSRRVCICVGWISRKWMWVGCFCKYAWKIVSLGTNTASWYYIHIYINTCIYIHISWHLISH